MRRLLSQVLFVMALLPLAACQAEEEMYQAGVHYEVLPEAVSTGDPSKVEIVEVFWYGCSHCYSFESKIKPWVQAQADDVNFVGVPAIWQSVMRLHAKAYYTAKALKVLDKMHIVIFEAMNLKKQKLQDEGEIANLFVANGVSRERFTKVFNSGSIEMSVDLAQKKQARYRTQGTPELVVNGKYRISGRDAGGHDGMIKVANFLIEKERAKLK
jgi:protein dithiol oxidoreductase (disulfide-forming)